eukprot:3865227-Amphidinium_carterae.1
MHSQGQRGYEPKPAHAGSPSTNVKPHDFGTIPEGKVRSVVTAFNIDRYPPSTAGTNSPPRRLSPREEVQLEAPRQLDRKGKYMAQPPSPRPTDVISIASSTVGPNTLDILPFQQQIENYSGPSLIHGGIHEVVSPSPGDVTGQSTIPPVDLASIPVGIVQRGSFSHQQNTPSPTNTGTLQIGTPQGTPRRDTTQKWKNQKIGKRPAWVRVEEARDLLPHCPYIALVFKASLVIDAVHNGCHGGQCDQCA